MNLRRNTVLAGLVIVALLLPPSVPAASTQSRPNFLVIITDDQRYDTMDYMPQTKARIFDQGLAFANAFTTTSLCCPSRASLFTGMRAGRHGVEQNVDPLMIPTVAQHLHDAGYYTGQIGKYLNSWQGGARPEFDFWVSSVLNPVQEVVGTPNRYTGYATHVYRDYARDFLQQAAGRDQPFFLTVATDAPHAPADPAPGDESLYIDLPSHRPPSFNEQDVSDKPDWVRALPKLSPTQISELDNFRRKQLQSLNAVDLAVADLLTLLEEQGRLDDTVVLFLSDNGVFWGEHRVPGGKNRVYDEATRVPFAIRFPRLITEPRVVSRLVANIDIAPTLYALAGLSIPAGVDGRSLVPLMTGTSAWRTQLLLEGWSEGGSQSYRAIRTESYLYVDNKGTDELYDLEADPFLLQNQVNNPGYDAVEADLTGRLAQLVGGATIIDDTALAVTYGGWTSTASGGWKQSWSIGGSYRMATDANRTIRYSTLQPTTSVAVISYLGPDQGQIQITIDGQAMETLDLFAPEKQWRYTRTYNNLPLAQHTIVVTNLGTRNPASTGTEVRVDAIVAGSTTMDENQGEVQYGAWLGTRNLRAYAGSYRAADSQNARVEFTVSGDSFTWISARGPANGMAEVWVDGALMRTVDLYRETQQWRYQVKLSGLGVSTHSVRILVLDKRNPSSKASTVVFDGVIVPSPASS